MSRASYPTIFGPVADGVPSPLIQHEHPYPTRYHGPIWDYPYFSNPYRENPTALMPYAGLPAAFGACGACSPKAGGESFGAINVTGSPSGSWIWDGVLGGLVGALIADTQTDRVVWAAGGAVATIVLGSLGLIGTVGAGYLSRR